MPIVYQIFGYAVWGVFIYLGYRTLCIVLAGFRRRKQIRRELDRWNGSETLVTGALCDLEKIGDAVAHGPIASKRKFTLRIEQFCQSLLVSAYRNKTKTQALPGNVSAERVLAHVVLHELHGRTDLAVRERDLYFEQCFFRCEDESDWTTVALRFGLLGTVGGAAEAFAASGDAALAARMEALSFALYTTAAGLVLAITIDFVCRKIFYPAFHELCAAVEDALLHVSAKMAELNTLVAQTEARPRKTSDRTEQVDAKRNGNGKPHRDGVHGGHADRSASIPAAKPEDTHHSTKSEHDHVEAGSNKK